jgi:DNA-binding response OmpR family regulator
MGRVCEIAMKNKISNFTSFSKLTARLTAVKTNSWYTKRMRILIVEDEETIREFESTYLRDAGFEVVEAADGQEAIDLFKEHVPDLAIIDINLPKVSGLEVCKIIRKVSAVPILIVTALGSDEDEIKGLSTGADDYIKKPFNPNVLVARVQALFRRHDKTKQLKFKGLVIDPKTMSVIKDEEIIRLTTTRFNLLLALASHPCIVFSREQLVEQIYSDPSSHFVYDRTIDAHIKALRQSIEQDSKNPQFIETVIGTGYRFIGEPDK